MNRALIDQIARAVLYEGYILYPYRRGTRNHHRWTFGGVFPRDYHQATGGAEPFATQTQCLLRGRTDTTVSATVRFLHLIDRRVSRRSADGASFEPVDEIEVAGKRYQTWQEACERTLSIDLNITDGAERQAHFAFPADRTTEPIEDGNGRVVAILTRAQSAIEGTVEIRAARVRDDILQLTVRTLNLTPRPRPAGSLSREQAALHSMASTHTVLTLNTGEFVSLIDPPAHLAEPARRCQNIGAWPVLAGEVGSTDAMLAAPIILYDYPQVAPESPGDLFDGTEIDEILSLRILTLADQEKRDAADLDHRAAALLSRTWSLSRETLLRLHGTIRPPRGIQAVHVADAELRVGGRVRLNPRGRADAFDIMLRGKTATIAAIEQDYENRIHVAVTIDDDPGADIGAAGRIGHRFFFGLDELEPVRADKEAPAP